MFIGLSIIPIKQIPPGFSAIQYMTQGIGLCDHMVTYSISNCFVESFHDDHRRLRKRAAKSHLNVFEIILVLI